MQTFYNLLDSIPNAEFSPNFENSLYEIMKYYNGFAMQFSFLNTLLTIMTLGISIELGFIIFKAITYVMNLIRGSGN